MKLAVIGTGYVGLVTGVGFAEMGHHVTCIDVDKAKIAKLSAGQPTIYEPGLEELMKRNQKEGRLSFSGSYEAAVESEASFIAVGTPPGEDGSADLTYVLKAAASIGDELTKASKDNPLPPKLVINKSTVPVGTAHKVKEAVASVYSGAFEVVSNPEFLREGTAVGDVLKPDRVVIGIQTKEAEAKMRELYRPFETTILVTDPTSAELIKYASNSLLATEISFINLLSRLAAKTGADITQVAAGIKLDKRIGPNAFLSAGPGYGGSCFPKDVQALAKTLAEYQVDTTFLDAVEQVNADQRVMVAELANELLKDTDNPRVALWGLAFKANTDDVRMSPALDIARLLMRRKDIHIIGYDPEAEVTTRAALPELKLADSSEEAIAGADLLLILTDWSEFKQPDLAVMAKKMRSPRIVDARNLYDPAEARAAGFEYRSIGRA